MHNEVIVTGQKHALRNDGRSRAEGISQGDDVTGAVHEIDLPGRAHVRLCENGAKYLLVRLCIGAGGIGDPWRLWAGPVAVPLARCDGHPATTAAPRR